MLGQVTVQELKNQILSLIKFQFPQIEVIDGFSSEQYFGQLEKILVAVSIEKIEIESVGLQDYLGSGVSDQIWKEQRGQAAKIQFGFTFYRPINDQKIAENEFFLKICDELAFKENLNFTSFVCSSPVFQQELQCFTTSMKAEAQAMLMKEEETAILSGFRLETDVRI